MMSRTGAAALRAADWKLRNDVAARGYPRTAKWMYCGVRLAGSPWLPTKSRWGYGWPWGRGYRPLSASEKVQAAVLLPNIDGEAAGTQR